MRYLTIILLPALLLMTLQGCRCSCSGDETPETTSAMLPDSMENPAYVKLHVNPIGGSLGKVFNDLNATQLTAARTLGIRPIESLHSAWTLDHPLEKIESNSLYHVDSLTHSVPFLVPEAAQLLSDIGERFNDTLAARGGGDYRIKVTSVLRTAHAVTSLRKKNINATQESTHQYGTTFDISYVDFINDTLTVPRSQEDLKNLLGEILKELRDENRCYVKYERKQGCFHITVRPETEK